MIRFPHRGWMVDYLLLYPGRPAEHLVTETRTCDPHAAIDEVSDQRRWCPTDRHPKAHVKIVTMTRNYED